MTETIYEDRKSNCSFFQNLNCCNAKEEAGSEFLLKDESKDLKFYLQVQKRLDDLFPIFPINYIRDDEKSEIKFTKDGILELINNLLTSNFIPKFTKKNIKISILDSSIFSKDFPIIHCEIETPKIFFKRNLKTYEIINAMTNPILRKKWDTNLKQYEIIEIINENTDIVKQIVQKQWDTIGERVFYKKRWKFNDEEDLSYCFSSSVPENLFCEEDDPVRGNIFLEVMSVKEDKENYVINYFRQFDIKMKIPQEFLEKNLYVKIFDIFEGFVNFLSKM